MSESAFTMGPALLFCPADRSERYGKAANRADAVILDLEDAVAPESKAAARVALIDQELDPARTIVRVNPVDTHEFILDMAALGQTKYRTVMVAKATSAGRMADIADYAGYNAGGYDVIALCESATGVLAAAEIAAAPNVVALMWGAEDLLASLGGTSSRFPNGSYRQVAASARSTILMAARAYEKTAIDTVYLDIPDIDGLASEANDAVASGFGATACIHPSQVEVIRAAYRPNDEDIAYAQDVLAAARGERGVFQFRGLMIDAPILRHVHETLRRSEILPD